MLFLQLMLYSSSFVGTLKNEIPEAALELCQLKIKQLSPDILKFRTNHQDNPFTLNYSVAPRNFLFVFHGGSRGLGSNNSRNWSYREKSAGSVRISRLSFLFLWLWLQFFNSEFDIVRSFQNDLSKSHFWITWRVLVITSHSFVFFSGKRVSLLGP